MEQNAEIGPGRFPGRFPSRFPSAILCKIGTFSGFAAIFLTANALCSPVRKENPASRACGKNNNKAGETSGKNIKKQM